jgi:hypothetical protein
MAILLIGMILLTLGIFGAIGIGIRTVVRRRRAVATEALA